jgi:predicted alpha/beta-fold hydrolase
MANPPLVGTPSENDFVPHPWFKNAHAQTLAGNFQRRHNLLPPAEDQLLSVEPDGEILCHCHWQQDRAKRLTLVIVHGLEGSSDSRYVIGTGSQAWKLGWNVVRMNMRNCGGTEKLSPTLYHSGMSSDVGAVVRALIEHDKLPRIALAGFSMGGNLVMKLTGEWGTHAPPEVRAVVGISPAIDLAISADTLHNRENRLYEWKFMNGLRSRIKRKAKLFPGRYDLRYLKGVKTIREFDNEITARYSGFSSADDYYARASASRVVDQITVPTLVIHALDDPFIRMTRETRDKLEHNPQITFIETAQGGHCAFLAQPNGRGDDGRWAEKRLIDFIAGLAGDR